MKLPHPTRGACRGFTLIELLAVIAVVGVLSALLLSTLTAIRRAARATQDAAILRTLGQSMLAYATEHHGSINYWGLEQGGVANETQNSFWGRAWPYLQGQQRLALTGENMAKMGRDFISPTIAAERPDLIGNNEGVDYTIAINGNLATEVGFMGQSKMRRFQRLQNVSRPSGTPYMTTGVWGFFDLNPYPLPAERTDGKKPTQEVYWLQKGGKGTTAVMLDGSVFIWTEKITANALWTRSNS